MCNETPFTVEKISPRAGLRLGTAISAGQLSVLVSCIGGSKPAQESVVRLTNCPYITIAVYIKTKTTTYLLINHRERERKNDAD